MRLQRNAMFVPRRVLVRPVCLAFNAKIDVEQLRSRLDQLHAEAETTRAKANSARLRLMRLSEVAEKLKQQAAINVHSGKEDEARDLLFQKKKVMHAMERSKSRIELLDELSAKLHEAISVKERQLIKNVASDLEVDREYASGPVWIISPEQGVTNDMDGKKDFDSAVPRLADSQDMQFCVVDEERPPIDKETGSCAAAISNEDTIIRGLKGIYSYEDFLEHLDLQLNRIEAELVTILNVSSLVLTDNEKLTNSKLQQTIELLESVHAIRQRITRIMHSKVEIR